MEKLNVTFASDKQKVVINLDIDEKNNNLDYGVSFDPELDKEKNASDYAFTFASLFLESLINLKEESSEEQKNKEE